MQLNLKKRESRKRGVPKHGKQSRKDHSLSQSSLSRENCLNVNNVLATNSTIVEQNILKQDAKDVQDQLMASAMENITESNDTILKQEIVTAIVLIVF